MPKKQKREQGREAAAPKPQAPPTFRPLADKLKKLADDKRAEEKEREKQQRESAAKPGGKTSSPGTPKKGAQPHAGRAAPVAQRTSTLTEDEKRELAAMSRDDEFFFQRLMSGVVPLSGEKKVRVTTAPIDRTPRAQLGPPAVDPDQEARDHLMNLVEGAARFEVSDDGRRLEGRRLDLGSSTWRRLRLGELPIDARLDLHGQSAEQAREAIAVFLRERRTRRDRVVLVIHGRGDHSPAGVGVLRGEIAAWLSQGASSQHVAAFATARAADGGEGALYVLLRV